MLGTHKGTLVLLLRGLPGQRQLQTPLCGDEGEGSHHFLPLLLSINLFQEAPQHQQWRPKLLTPGTFTPTPVGASLPGQVCLRTRTAGPCPENQHRLPAHTTSTDHRVLQSFSSSGNSIRSLLTSKPEYTYLKLATL